MSVEDLSEILRNLSITSADSIFNTANNILSTAGTSTSNNFELIDNNISIKMSVFKPEYLNCVPTFDGNPNDLNRYLATCDSLIRTFYDTSDPSKFENIYLINCLIGKLTGTAKVVINIQNVSNWDDLKSTLQRNFADQRDEACLNRDLVMLRQQLNETPSQYYDKVLHILNLLCSYVDTHEQSDAAKTLKRNLYSDLALKTFLSGLREPLGTNIRCMRPPTLPEAMQMINQEHNNQYFQNQTKIQNTKPMKFQNSFSRSNNYPNQNSNSPNYHTPNDFFRRQNNAFPSQPINVQSRPQPQKFFTNSQVFGKPQNQNVFRPGQTKNFQKPIPMSTTTRFSSNNTRNPYNNNLQNQRQGFPNQQQKNNVISEELYNTEINQYSEVHDEYDQSFDQNSENQYYDFEGAGSSFQSEEQTAEFPEGTENFQETPQLSEDT